MSCSGLACRVRGEHLDAPNPPPRGRAVSKDAVVQAPAGDTSCSAYLFQAHQGNSLYNSISDHDTLNAALQQSIAAGDKSGGVVYTNWNKKYSVRAGVQLTNHPETDPLDVAWLKTCAPRTAPPPPPAQAPAPPLPAQAKLEDIRQRLVRGGLHSLTAEQLRFLVGFEKQELPDWARDQHTSFKERLARVERDDRLFMESGAQTTALPSSRDAEMKKIQDQVKTGDLDSLTVEQLRFIVKDFERVPISELGGQDKQEYDDFKKRLAEKESTTDAASQQKMIMVGAGAIVVLLLLRSRRR
jgi:hypothetical protein